MITKWIVALALTGAVLAGCSDDDGDDGARAAAGVTTATPTQSQPRSPAATLTPTPTESSTSDPFPDHARWAAAVCSIADDVLQAERALRDNLDPSTLSIDERKGRAARIAQQLVPAYMNAAAELSSVESPSEDTSRYVSALADQAEALAEALEDSAALIAAATTATEIEAANARVDSALETGNLKVREAAGTLTIAAVAALEGPTQCGSVRLAG